MTFEDYLRRFIKDAVIEAVNDMQKIQAQDPGIEAAVAIGAEEAAEPGTRRKRRTKAEIEADSQTRAVPLAQPVQTAPAVKEPVVEYKEVQIAVLDLCNADKRQAVTDVLAQFGVANAKQLQSEQWAECLQLLKAAGEEESLA